MRRCPRSRQVPDDRQDAARIVENDMGLLLVAVAVQQDVRSVEVAQGGKSLGFPAPGGYEEAVDPVLLEQSCGELGVVAVRADAAEQHGIATLMRGLLRALDHGGESRTVDLGKDHRQTAGARGSQAARMRIGRISELGDLAQHRLPGLLADVERGILVEAPGNGADRYADRIGDVVDGCAPG